MLPPKWSTACPDWERRIVERQPLISFQPLFQAEADAALEVFKSLRVVDAPGRPTFGQAGDEFVFAFVAAIFGAYDAHTARRYISEFLLLISKKNGKSTIAAGIMLTALIRNWRHLQELLILAPSLETANNSFAPAAAMVRADPELAEILKPIDHQRLIRHLVTKAELKVVSADNDVVGGTKAGFVLVEELWLFGKKPRAKDMLVEATGGLSARPEGFVIYLTTHSDEPPAGVFLEKLRYARDVRDGAIADPSFLPVLYEWPPQMLEAKAYLDPNFFYVTNPNLGRSVQKDWIANKLAQEECGEGDGVQGFLAKHLNVEIGLRLRRDRWRGADYWLDAIEPGLTLDEILARAEVAVVGIDGGGKDDLLGLAVLGRCRETQTWLLWTKAWCHEEVLTRRKDIAEQLRDFEKAGELVVCRENKRQDLEEVQALLLDLDARGLLPEEGAIGVDTLGMPTMEDALREVGLEAPKVAAVRQGVFLNGVILAMERKLDDGGLVHCGQGVAAWCVGNAKAVLKGSAVTIEKMTAGRAKIDVLVAAFNAYSMMARGPKAKGASVYRTRGFLTI